MSERKCIVTTKLGVDIDAFVAEMNSLGRESVHVPERAVEVSDIMTDSGVNTEFMLTDAERTELLNDDRVIDAVWSDLPIIAVLNASINNITYNRGGTFTSTERPWSWASSSSNNNPFGTASSLSNQTRNYTLTGEGVDVVVIDSGIEADHPEWLNANGTASRFQRIDWTSPTFAAGNVSNAANMYTDVVGHGTACHSALAGRRYGLAPSANIYSMSVPVFGSQLPNSTWPSSVAGFSYVFQRLNAWHQNKPIEATGYRRPTIVNMSWNFAVSVGDLTNYGSSNLTGNYRGNSFSFGYNNTNSANLGSIGIVTPTGTYNVNSDILAAASSGAVDAEIAACRANGIIFVAAAGNDRLKISALGDPDFNNSVDNPSGGFAGSTIYYHRGGTPITGGAITVGGVSATYDVTSGQDNKLNVSRSGPGVHVYSPAQYLPLAISSTETQSGSTGAYPGNASYSAIKISGTSFAAPTVAGWLACMAEARPYLNQAMAQQLVEQTATANKLATSGSTYTNLYFLNNGNNRYLFNPFNSNTVSIVESSGNINIGGTF